MNTADEIRLAWERAKGGDQRAGRYVLSACLDYVRQLKGGEIEVQVLESILEQILAGTDAGEATWTRPGDGNPAWNRQWRHSVIVSAMRAKIAEGLSERAAAKFLAAQEHDIFANEDGAQLGWERIRKIWSKNKDRADFHITFGRLDDEWDEPA